MENSMKNFEVKLLTDKSRINEIVECRLMAWRETKYAQLVDDNNFLEFMNDDKEDDHHFIIEDEGKIIAIARIQIMNDIGNLPPVFKNFQLPKERPFGDYERVATHPDYRGLGLVHLIDDFVLKFAKEIGLPFITAYVLTQRDKTFIRLGYKQIGTIDNPDYREKDSPLTSVAFIYQF